MIKVWFLFLTIFLFLGCSSKKEQAFIEEYKESKVQSKKLQKTEKIRLYDKQEGTTKVLITLTYLFKKEIKNKKEDEVFIVGIYVDENETQDSSIESFSMRLNAKAANSIKVLEENSQYLKNIPFVFPWNKFYLVSFPYSTRKSMYLNINHVYYGEERAFFAKVAKYVLDKKAF